MSEFFIVGEMLFVVRGFEHQVRDIDHANHSGTVAANQRRNV